MTSKIKIIFAVLALAAFSAKAQTTNLFLAFADSTKKELVLGSQTMQTKAFGRDTASAIKAVQEIIKRLEQDSAALVASFRDNRSQHAQAMQIIAVLTPGKPGTQPAETPEQKELRLLREENARLKSEKDRPKKNR
jgi:multidrug efflux pump subunit AcrB